MKILHYYTEGDGMTAQYVGILSQAMAGMEAMTCDGSIENISTTSLAQARRILKNDDIDLLHLHGCWRDTDWLLTLTAEKSKTRVILSPHGNLQPWVIRQDYWKSHLPRIIAYQRHIVSSAYAVITMGRMEYEGIKRLEWSDRIEMVLNAMITESITEYDMARQILTIYNKVMDSNTLALITGNTRKAYSALIKAGTTKDSRWLDDDDMADISQLKPVAWRRIIISAWHSGIIDIIADAIDTLQLPLLDIHPKDIACYMPAAENRKGLFNKEVKELPAVIADDKGMHTDSFILFVKQLHKRAKAGLINMKDIVETSVQLRRVTIDERLFMQEMTDKKLDAFLGSIMQLAMEYTSIEEGFLICAPRTGRMTRKIRKIIENQHNIRQ